MTSDPTSLTEAARQVREMLARNREEDTQAKRDWATQQLIRLSQQKGRVTPPEQEYYASCSLLHILIELEDTAGLRQALELGEEVSRPNPYSGRTPLHEAAERNNTPGMAMLLEFGADLEETDKSGETALHYATGRQDPIAAEWLLDRGANLEARNQYGKTPLFLAAQGYVEVLDCLLKRGADSGAVDKDGDTVLAHAIQGENLPCVLRLIEHGCDLNQPDAAQWTPLQLAINRGHRPIFEALVNHGASVEHDPTNPLFHMLVDYERVDWAESLLKAGADPHRVNAERKTVLEHIHGKADSAVLAAQWRQMMMGHNLPPARPKAPSPRF